ncbi:MAG TPA: tetrapyrrole methylase [Proteobacteria bacterium]|nr:tetrapyrrole methylase [Pseudomonadota bacterium]
MKRLLSAIGARRAFLPTTKKLLISGLLLLWTIGCTPQPQTTIAPQTTPGSFAVVGLGPGDADLVTTRALEAIRQADLVFCSAKTKEELSSYVDFTGKELRDGYGVLFRYYGKVCPENADKPSGESGKPRMSCEEYHRHQAEFAALVRTAVAAGRRVVILSGGDPMIYGPDIWSLKELHDLDPQVIPGLSAFNAANAALQVRLGEVILTAPFQREGAGDSIEQLAGHERATLVIFMPRDLKKLFDRLAAVYAAETPVAVVADAGVVGREQVTLGSVAGFQADSSAIDSRRSLIYVGQALATAQYRPAPLRTAGRGKFYLVRVGPGDADLATQRALQVIEKADLIFAQEKIRDRFQAYLTGKQVLTAYHRLFPFYGKDCAAVKAEEQGRERRSCEEYHRQQAEFAALVRAAVAEGKTVAMLDSGDPMIYGPDAWALTELADLDTEVVPGLSCFNAANAALRAGVTEGRHSHSVIFASGWSVGEMAVHQSSMVLFTMRTDFKKFVDTLGRSYAADTPVALVCSAGYADREKVIHGTLGTILEQVGGERPPFEYLLYIGDFLRDSVDYLNR